MKIKHINVHVIKSELDVPFAFSQGWVNQRAATLIEIITDEEITGWGECFPQGLEPPEIAAAAVENCFSKMLKSIKKFHLKLHDEKSFCTENECSGITFVGLRLIWEACRGLMTIQGTASMILLG